MKENNKVQFNIKRFFIMLVIAILIAALMTILSAFPPLSFVYNWLSARNLSIIWFGLIAGVIGGALSFYNVKRKNNE